jgi:hypothetical protein
LIARMAVAMKWIANWWLCCIMVSVLLIQLTWWNRRVIGTMNGEIDEVKKWMMKLWSGPVNVVAKWQNNYCRRDFIMWCSCLSVYLTINRDYDGDGDAA